MPRPTEISNALARARIAPVEIRTLRRQARPCAKKSNPSVLALQAAPRCEQAGKRRRFEIRGQLQVPFSRTLRALRAEKIEPCVARRGRCVKNVEPSALATQGSIFSARDSRPRQRVRNFGSAWRTTNKSRKHRAKRIDFQERLSSQIFFFWSPATQSTFDSSGAPKGSKF